MTTAKEPNDGQIRLLIPKSWIDELDTVANLKRTTRLGAIRLLLRAQIDLELNRVHEYLERKQKTKWAKESTDKWLLSQRNEDKW